MENLKDLIENSGLTLTEISNLSGIPLSTLFVYMKGQITDVNKELYNVIYKVLSEYNQANFQANELNGFNENNNFTNEEGLFIGNNLFSHPSEKINENFNTEQSEELSIDIKEIKESIENNTPKSNYNPIHNYSQVTPSQIKRKEIWYIKNNTAVGGEIVGNRPFLVIGNEKTIQINKTVIGVYLTKTPRSESPFHVTIKTNVMSTAICEQINTVSIDRFVNKVGEITDVELALIEKAIINALGIKINNSSNIFHSPDYISLKTELLVYKKIYEDYIRIQENKN